MATNVIAFKTTPSNRFKPYEDAIAGMKADEFFAPFLQAYGDDLGWDCILYENGHGDLGCCDDRGLLFRMKLTAISVHFDNLREADCYEGTEYYDEFGCQIANELDKSPEAFVVRFADYYADDYPVLKDMLEFALASRGVYGAWGLMRWILLWSESMAGRAVEEEVLGM